MGEAIISRHGGGGEQEPQIPIIAGYHTILATLKTDDGRAVINATLACKDGTRWYNYTTNEKGQALFTCNSGWANFYLDNNINGIIYRDIICDNRNIAAPIGSTTRLNLSFNKAINFIANQSMNINIYSPRVCNIQIEGGGGGGSTIGAGGGSGYVNTYNGKTLIPGPHNFIAGGGGSTGGGTGGTSTLDNIYSAVGGSGGSGSTPGKGYQSGDNTGSMNSWQLSFGFVHGGGHGGASLINGKTAGASSWTGGSGYWTWSSASTAYNAAGGGGGSNKPSSGPGSGSASRGGNGICIITF